MKVVFHTDFYEVYTSDPAAGAGRMEPIVEALSGIAEFVDAEPADIEDIRAIHSDSHIDSVRTHDGLYDIAALAAGGAVQAAEFGLKEPCFGLIRPPGHHASRGSYWGFCYFNNMAIAIHSLKSRGLIDTAFILDFDLHDGDGTVNILDPKDYVTVYNAEEYDIDAYRLGIKEALEDTDADIIGISAGFDNHEDDWGGLLKTSDYELFGRQAKEAADRNKAGLFAILEGGYNHGVLGENTVALLHGMSGG